MIKLEIIPSQRIWKRIKTGVYLDENLKPYSKLEIESVIRDFIESEEYEKCHFLSEFIKKRFNHELNYTL